MKKYLFILSIFLTVSSCSEDEETYTYIDTVLPPAVENFRTGTHGGEFALFWDYQYNNQIKGFHIIMNPGNVSAEFGAYEYFYVVPDYHPDLYNHYLIRAEDKKGNFSEAVFIDLTD